MQKLYVCGVGGHEQSNLWHPRRKSSKCTIKHSTTHLLLPQPGRPLFGYFWGCKALYIEISFLLKQAYLGGVLHLSFYAV